MKIGQIRDDYLEASGKVSDLVRQLSFAGVGVIWVLRVGDSGNIKYFDTLVFPLACFVGSLTSDLCQYIYKTILLYNLNQRFFRIHGDNEAEVSYSEKWNIPTHCLFWAKTVATLVGYSALLIFLLCQF